MNYERRHSITGLARALAAALGRPDFADLRDRAINVLRYTETGARVPTLSARHNLRLNDPEATKLAIVTFAGECGLGVRQLTFPRHPDDLNWPRADELASKADDGWCLEIAVGHSCPPGETGHGTANSAVTTIRHDDDQFRRTWQPHVIWITRLFWLPDFLRNLSDAGER